MRVMVYLSARADTAYQDDYHHKLRGRLWRSLKETKFSHRHDEDLMPGFTYSNPFPPYDMEEGDERKLLIASPNEELLSYITRDLVNERELNIGEMPFHVDEVTSLNPDVGEPGTSGVIESGTGMLIRIPRDRCSEYGIDHPGGDTSVFWRPKHSMEPFKTQLENNLDQKHNRFAADYLPGPSDVDGELFDGYELIKTFSLPVTVSEGQTMTYILSKWRFSYTVKDDDHRRHLNLALDTGLAERNSLGLGFVNITEKKRPVERVA